MQILRPRTKLRTPNMALDLGLSNVRDSVILSPTESTSRLRDKHSDDLRKYTSGVSGKKLAEKLRPHGNLVGQLDLTEPQ